MAQVKFANLERFVGSLSEYDGRKSSGKLIFGVITNGGATEYHIYANDIDFVIPTKSEFEAFKSNVYTKAEVYAKAETYTQEEVNNKIATEIADALSTVATTYATKDALQAAKTELTTAINGKVDKEEGKGLSTNDYTTEEKTKLADIEEGAQVNKIEAITVNGSATPVKVTGTTADITITAAIDGLQENEKILSVSDAKLGTTLGVNITKKDDKEYIQLIGKNDAVIDEVDASVFVKDGMLDSATYDSTTHKIILVWNTDAGKDSTEIDVSDLVDEYTAGNGLGLQDNQFSVKINNTEHNVELSATSAGLSADIDLSNYATKAYVDDAVALEKQRAQNREEELENTITEEITRANNTESLLLASINAEAKRAEDAETELNTQIEKVSGDLATEITNRETAETVINNSISALDTRVTQAEEDIDALEAKMHDATVVTAVADKLITVDSSSSTETQKVYTINVNEVKATAVSGDRYTDTDNGYATDGYVENRIAWTVIGSANA